MRACHGQGLKPGALGDSSALEWRRGRGSACRGKGLTARLGRRRWAVGQGAGAGLRGRAVRQGRLAASVRPGLVHAGLVQTSRNALPVQVQTPPPVLHPYTHTHTHTRACTVSTPSSCAANTYTCTHMHTHAPCSYACLLEASMDHTPHVCSIPPRELLSFCLDQVSGRIWIWI